ATSIDGLEAKYTVKIDNNGYVTGFGLASAPNEDGAPLSEFYVRTDRFAMIDPGAGASATPTYPFIVSGGNTYIKEAMIETLSADKSTAGKITGSTLQTAAPGPRFEVKASDNEARFYGDRGDGTVE